MRKEAKKKAKEKEKEAKAKQKQKPKKRGNMNHTRWFSVVCISSKSDPYSAQAREASSHCHSTNTTAKSLRQPANKIRRIITNNN
jgi:hypothetical protein